MEVTLRGEKKSIIMMLEIRDVCTQNTFILLKLTPFLNLAHPQFSPEKIKYFIVVHGLKQCY